MQYSWLDPKLRTNIMKPSPGWQLRSGGYFSIQFLLIHSSLSLPILTFPTSNLILIFQQTLTQEIPSTFIQLACFSHPRNNYMQHSPYSEANTSSVSQKTYFYWSPRFIIVLTRALHFSNLYWNKPSSRLPTQPIYFRSTLSHPTICAWTTKTLCAVSQRKRYIEVHTTWILITLKRLRCSNDQA